MSQRTIVEFNHDCGHEIDRDPEGFLRALRHLINSGSGTRENEALERFGVRVTPTHHHSVRARVVLGDGYFDEEL